MEQLTDLHNLYHQFGDFRDAHSFHTAAVVQYFFLH